MKHKKIIKIVWHLIDPTQKRYRISQLSVISYQHMLLAPTNLKLVMVAWASYQMRKIAGCAWAGNAGNVFPATDLKGNR